MKQYFVIVTLTLMSIVSIAQDREKVDSLLNIYQNNTEDTAKIFALKGLTWQYYFTGSDSTNYFLNLMIDLSKQVNYTKGLFDAYNIKGILYFTGANYDSAIIMFNKAFSLSADKKYNKEKIYSLQYSGRSFHNSAKFREADSCFTQIVKLARNSNDSTSLAKAYKSIAGNHYTRGDYLTALQYHFKADTFMINDLTIDHAENFQNIANVYHVLENDKAEARYYKEALKIYEAIDDDYGRNAIFMSLGRMENDNKNYLAAKDYLEKANAFFKNYNDPLIQASIEYNLGYSAYHLGDVERALAYYKKSLSKVEGVEGSLTLGNLYREMGRAYSSLEDYEQSLIYFEKALETSQKIGKIQSSQLALEALAETYFLIGDYQKAYTTQKRHQYFNDSVNKLHSDKVLHELEAKYQTEKKEQQVELLTAQNLLAEQKRQNQIYLLVGLAAFILAAAVVLYILYYNRQKTANKLQQLDATKSKFFANISHEFRTPLTLIKSPVQKQLSQENIEGDERENLQMINRNTDRLLSLVDQLLDLSRIEAGTLKLRIEKASLSSFSRAIIGPFVYLAEQKDIELDTHIVLDENCYFDKDIVEKIVVNLLSNAVKYTPVGGKIVYQQEVNKNWAVIEVKNTGTGIPIDQQQKIFDRFYQMSEAREGVGLGLALVKELVAHHKGSIRLKRDENEFTTFEVKLPVASADYSSAVLTTNKNVREKPVPEEESQPVAVAEDLITGEKPIMLIVEDNADLRELIRSLFSSSYAVLFAENGEEGINKAMEHIPDIIISDVMMPVKDGVELSQTLKADERTSHIPIILLTAKAGEENELKGLETGADEYMVKPFNNDILKVRVQKLIEIRTQLRARYSQEVILRPKEIAITSVDEKFLERVQSIIDTHITKPDFTAEFFSREIGMSRMQLHRKLKALIGLSTSEFIRSQRLKMATKLLDNPEVNISEVGYTVGFNDPSYFAKCFKETYGCTPSQYVAEAQTGS